MRNLNLTRYSIAKQYEAVEKNGCAIEDIEDPCLGIQLAAVRQNGMAIYYIKNPSLEVQLEAVKRNVSSVFCIDNPCLEVLLLAYNSKEISEHKDTKEAFINYKIKKAAYSILLLV